MEQSNFIHSMEESDFIHFPNIGVFPVYIQYKGIFDMQDLYESIAEFFRQKKFKFHEVQYRLRKPSPFGVEIAHNLRAERKIEEYYEWIVDITIETFDQHDVEVVAKDGTKKKMSKGRLWIYINGRVEMDYEENWEHSAFLAYLKSFYNKYIIRKRVLSVWWDQLYYKIVLSLHAMMKERLKMTSEGFEARHMSGVH